MTRATRLGERLSGGMRQKLAVAMALLHEPPLLLLDEPTTGIDPISRVDLWRLISAAAASGTAVLLSTVYIDEAERAAAVCVLDRGRVLLAGAPDAVIATVAGRMYTVGVDQARPSQECWRDGTTWRLYADGAPPAGAVPAQADLSDAVIAAALTVTGAGARRGFKSATASGTGAPAGGAAHDPDVLVSARGVSRRFGDFVAVHEVDLDVRRGEIVGLLGANGAGKTTLIRLLLGLLQETEGQIELFGRPPDRATRALLGYVPQGLGLWDDLTVSENLAFAAGAFAVRAPAALNPDLEAARQAPVRDLPLGLRRRLAFTAALAHDPRLLVLDEPTSGVDPLARARLWDTVHAAAERGAGVLVTTHYMDEASQCDRLVILAAGVVVAAGTVASIVGDRTVAEIRTGDWAAAFAALDAADVRVAVSGRDLRIAEAARPAAEAALTAAGIAASSRPVPATLEEVFVDLVTGAST